MHYQALLQKPAFEPFDILHEHKHFQLVEVKTRKGETCSYQKIYLSCRHTGHSDETLIAYLDSAYGIDDSYVGLGEGEHWLEYQEGAISIYHIDSDGTKIVDAPIYSIEDPELQNLKCYCNDLFEYSI